MQFTAADVIQSMYDRPNRRRDRALDAWMVARQFNRTMRRLMRRVDSADPERLAGEVVLDPADVSDSDDFVDLTSSGTRSWLSIYAMDWRTSASADFDGEVTLGTIEARHRLKEELGHYGNPLGYLYDGMSKIKKVSGWDGVYDVLVFGTAIPTEVSPNDSEGFNRIYDLPQPLREAIETDLALSLGAHLKLSELEAQRLLTEHQENMAALLDDAEAHVDPALRVDDVGHRSFYD